MEAWLENLLIFLAAYSVPLLLLRVGRFPRLSSWAAISWSAVALYLGCRAFAVTWSLPLFFGLVPFALLCIYAQSKLRDEERASLSIRR
jgi:uncharacterized membrane protein